jgi:tetratricopeptide (TPR) repeat protein
MSDLWFRLRYTAGGQAFAGATLLLVGLTIGLLIGALPLASYVRHLFPNSRSVYLDKCPEGALPGGRAECGAIKELDGARDPEGLNREYWRHYYIHRLLHQHELSIADMDAALAIPRLSDNSRALDYASRGRSELSLEEYGATEADYSQAITLYHGRFTWNLYFDRGTARIRMGMPALALADFNAALAKRAETIEAVETSYVRLVQRISPNDLKRFRARIDAGNAFTKAWILSERATAYRNLGQYERSLTDCDTAINLQPNNPLYYSGRARTEFMMGRWRAGFSDFWTRTKLVFGWQ